jgi:hypothetical protein
MFLGEVWAGGGRKKAGGCKNGGPPGAQSWLPTVDQPQPPDRRLAVACRLGRQLYSRGIFLKKVFLYPF